MEAATWSFGKHCMVARLHLICTSGSLGRLKAGVDALHLYSINLNVKGIEMITQQLIFSKYV